MGISEQELSELPRYQTSQMFSETEKLVLDLAVAMSSTPAEVPDSLRQVLLQHFSRGQLTEIAATIAWENHRARLNKALGVRAVGFSDGAFCVLPERPSD